MVELLSYDQRKQQLESEFEKIRIDASMNATEKMLKTIALARPKEFRK